MDAVTCPLCGTDVGERELCPHCRYPVNVRTLSQFGGADLRVFLADLAETSRGFGADRPLAPADEALLDACVSMDWLRPETVLFNFRQIRAVRAHASALTYPTVDLGCGTGVFTSLLHGAAFEPASDSYGTIDLARADAYDVHEPGTVPRLAKRPAPIGVGIDLRPSMVARSRELGVYDDVHCADVRAVPLPDGSMRSVYSNMFDDLSADGLVEALSEVRRVLAPGGHALLASPDVAFRDALVYHRRADEAAARGDDDQAARFRAMDRSRSQWQPRSRDEWAGLLAGAGLEPVGHEPFFDEGHMRFWDVGWRPFFPWLLPLRRALDAGGLLAAAKPTIVRLVRSYLQHEAVRPLTGRPTFSVVVARRPAGRQAVDARL